MKRRPSRKGINYALTRVLFPVIMKEERKRDLPKQKAKWSERGCT